MKKPKKVDTAFSTYRIENVIGEGGSGIVYKSKDEQGVSFAIKILNFKTATKEKMKRFKNEYTFCSQNKHRNIIAVLDYGLTNETPFFVMPLYESSLRPFVGKMEPKQALGIFVQILDGVEAAHKLNVVHRDLKPENILIGNNGSEAIVADFGIAEFEEEALYTAVETRDEARLANFQYAAPEQRSRGKAIDKRADIYALGLILNELFTAEIPHGTNYKTVKSISDKYAYLDSLVEKMLNQNPALRFPNIDDLKKELIARGEEFVTRQKISQLESVVIPSTEVDDILIHDPIRIVNVDWSNETLSIELNHPVNQTWVWAFKNMGNYSSLMGKDPSSFRFEGNRAIIPARSPEVQPIIDYFKNWLPKITEIYKNKLKQDQESKERREREELQNSIRKEKERADLLGRISY